MFSKLMAMGACAFVSSTVTTLCMIGVVMILRSKDQNNFTFTIFVIESLVNVAVPPHAGYQFLRL
jgi:hypothetical protein